MFFGLFKKKEPPILKPEMLEPINAPISTAEAKKVYKDWMLKIGYLDRQEVGDHVRYFADDMKGREEDLKEELNRAKEDAAFEVNELKEYLAKSKKDIAESADPAEKKKIKKDIESMKEEIKIASQACVIEQACVREIEAIQNFKADKREFLVNYINDQVHGRDWRSKL